MEDVIVRSEKSVQDSLVPPISHLDTGCKIRVGKLQLCFRLTVMFKLRWAYPFIFIKPVCWENPDCWYGSSAGLQFTPDALLASQACALAFPVPQPWPYSSMTLDQVSRLTHGLKNPYYVNEWWTHSVENKITPTKSRRISCKSMVILLSHDISAWARLYSVHSKKTES